MEDLKLCESDYRFLCVVVGTTPRWPRESW